MFILLSSEFLHLRSVRWILADLYSFYQIRNFCILSQFYSHFIKRRIRAIKEIGNRTSAHRLRIFDQRAKGISGKKEKQYQSMFINPRFIDPCFLNPWFINPCFINPCFINPCFINPWFINPCFINPWFISPCFINPYFTNPWFISPCFINPCFINPCFINPCFINPWFINPCFINPCFINPRTYKGGGGGGGGGWSPPPSEDFLFFFSLDDKTSASEVFSSCLFISRANFEISLVMVS